MADEVGSISRWLWGKSNKFYDLEDYKTQHGDEAGTKKYQKDVQELLAPLEGDPDYGLLSLHDDGEGLGYGLMHIIKARINLSVKLILVKIDSHKSNRSDISCTNDSVADYREPQTYGEEFGLHFDSGHANGDPEGYHNTTLSFFGENLPPVIFNSLGVQRAPIDGHIDVYLKTDEYFSANATVFVNVGREQGNVEVVEIQGKTISSALPVIVHGTSEDWAVHGVGACPSCTIPPHPWDVDYENHRTRSHWNIDLLGGSDGEPLVNKVTT